MEDNNNKKEKRKKEEEKKVIIKSKTFFMRSSFHAFPISRDVCTPCEQIVVTSHEEPKLISGLGHVSRAKSSDGLVKRH